MRKIVCLTAILLAFLLAAPFGAAFASEEVVHEQFGTGYYTAHQKANG